ncbi:MAG: hypothetical protein NTX38_06495 [Methylobacter sp.]|nr:hypothetical protein [Methylobacter sp.]
MILKKRGLGRGLEALLADDSVKKEQHRSPVRQAEEINIAVTMAKSEQVEVQTEERSAMVIALFKNIQKENRLLLEEAESLRQLIAEFESIVRADLQ